MYCYQLLLHSFIVRIDLIKNFSESSLFVVEGSIVVVGEEVTVIDPGCFLAGIVVFVGDGSGKAGDVAVGEGSFVGD